MHYWSITAKKTDCSTGPLARPFAGSLAPLTRSLAPDCSLCSRPSLRSLMCSLAHFAHSHARGTVNDWMAFLSVFFFIFDHSGINQAQAGGHFLIVQKGGKNLFPSEGRLLLKIYYQRGFLTGPGHKYFYGFLVSLRQLEIC